MKSFPLKSEVLGVLVDHSPSVLEMILLLFESVIQFFLASYLATTEVVLSPEGVIGPQGTLEVANKVIAPDGFPRSYVFSLLLCHPPS